MAFVHGHARDTGWVVAHVRAPVDAEEGQLELVAQPPAADAPDPAPVTGEDPAPGAPAPRR